MQFVLKDVCFNVCNVLVCFCVRAKSIDLLLIVDRTSLTVREPRELRPQAREKR